MKRILTTLKEKWPEYLLEVIVITVGILGAFLLNNWNENRKIRNEQEEIVENLHEEFKTNLGSLDNQMFRLRRKIRACSQMAELIHPSKLLPDTIAIDTLVKRLYDNPTWNPSTYVLSDLRSSGQLKSLKNEELKLLLHNWEQHYENLKEWYVLEMQLYDKLMKFMAENGSVRNAMFFRTFGETPFDTDNADLFRSVEFENHVSHILMITAGLENIYVSETVGLINQILKETE